MNPNEPSKPALDMAAPTGTTPVPAPTDQASAPASQPAAPISASADLSVRPAPVAQAVPEPQATAPAAAPALVAKKPVPDTPRKPVALITVTVFIMLVLSILAVTAYVTSRA